MFLVFFLLSRKKYYCGILGFRKILSNNNTCWWALLLSPRLNTNNSKEV